MVPATIVSVAMAALSFTDEVKCFFDKKQKKTVVSLPNHHQNSHQEIIRVSRKASEYYQLRNVLKEENNIHWGGALVASGGYTVQTMREANVLHRQRNEIEQGRNLIWRTVLSLNQVYAAFRIMSSISFWTFGFSGFTFGPMSAFKLFVLYSSVSFLFGIPIVLYTLSGKRDTSVLSAFTAFTGIWTICTFAAFISVFLPFYPGFICYISSCLVWFFAIIGITLIEEEKLEPDAFKICFFIFCSFSPFLVFFYYLFA